MNLLHYLNIGSWFDALDIDVKSKLMKYHGNWFNVIEQDYSNVTYTNETVENFYSQVYMGAFAHGDYSFAEFILPYLKIDSWDCLSLHFFYQEMIEVCYKRIGVDADARNYAKYFAEKNIHILVAKKKQLLKEFDLLGIGIPEVTAFKRLSMIYDSQNQFDEAIAICKSGIENNYILDGTKYGLPGRIAKLQKKTITK